MQNIEINTTQNVHITYEVAHFGDRALAFLIDLLVIGGGLLLCMLFSVIITNKATSFVFYFIAVPYVAFYTLVSEILMKGQTLGKKALKVQVVKLNGVEARSSDYFLRWIFRLIDIYLSLGMVASIFISTSKKGQRLGDLISETSAIRIKPSKELMFSEVERKYRDNDYEPKYPQVKRLSENEMLLVQSVLMRYKKYKNKAHRETLFALSNKLKSKLNLSESEVEEEGIQFLTILIKDYIAITR